MSEETKKLLRLKGSHSRGSRNIGRYGKALSSTYFNEKYRDKLARKTCKDYPEQVSVCRYANHGEDREACI